MNKLEKSHETKMKPILAIFYVLYDCVLKCQLYNICYFQSISSFLSFVAVENFADKYCRRIFQSGSLCCLLDKNLNRPTI